MVLLKYSPSQPILVKEIQATIEFHDNGCARVYGGGEGLVGPVSLIINSAVPREENGESFIYTAAETRERAYKVLLLYLEQQRLDAVRKANEIVDNMFAIIEFRDDDSASVISRASSCQG